MDSHGEDTVDVDIEYDDLSETSSDMSSDDGEISQECWDGCSDDDIVTDFDDINEVNSAPHLVDKNNIYHISLMFIMLWASLYGFSATALNHLVQLLHYVYSILLKNMSTTATFFTLFPKSLYMMKKYLGFSKDTFEKYVICEKCGSLYTFKGCFVTNATGRCKPKLCNHIAFRHHPHPTRRKPCSHQLLKEITLKSQLKYYPRKLYCFNPITNGLMNIL